MKKITPAQFKKLLIERAEEYELCAKRDMEKCAPASGSIYAEMAKEIRFILSVFERVEL